MLRAYFILSTELEATHECDAELFGANFISNLASESYKVSWFIL